MGQVKNSKVAKKFDEIDKDMMTEDINIEDMTETKLNRIRSLR